MKLSEAASGQERSHHSPAGVAGPSFAGGLVPSDAQLLTTRSSLRRVGPGISTPLTCAVRAPQAGSAGDREGPPAAGLTNPGG
jgi:hypothetical protein